MRKDFGHDGPIPSLESTAGYHWSDSERARAEQRSQSLIVGTPARVHTELLALAEAHGADELMLNTLTSDPADRLNAYRLIADELIN